MNSVSKRVVDLPVAGEKLEFNDARERTGGRRSEGIVTLGPGSKGPGAHIHTRQVEGFEVLSGSLVVDLGGKIVTVRAGETILVQPGEVHAPRNGSDTDPVVAKFWYEPALNMEWMLQGLGELAMARGGDWKHMPLLPAAHMLFTMRDEYRLGGMPFWLQDVIFGLLAALAVVTGSVKQVPPRVAGGTSALQG